MISVFNSFLVLFILWIATLFATDLLEMYYILAGGVYSFSISILCRVLRVINTANSSFLYLNLGFYTHYSSIILISLVKTLVFIVEFQFFSKKLKSTMYYISIERFNEHDLRLLITTIFFMPGIIYLGIKI